ncbi:DUF2254 family protein [Pannonibacter sp. Pt2-lr]
MSKWRWILQQYGQRLWVRVWFFCLAAVGVALCGAMVDKAGSLPRFIQVEAEAVSGILDILASSMLAVTTFSLSIMVSAYSAAASSTTPRANKLMLRDNTSQNALSVFIGAFCSAWRESSGFPADFMAAAGGWYCFWRRLVWSF